jgi:hypothetical protein
VERTEDDHKGQVLDGRTIERLGDVVCGLHRALGRFSPVWPQNQWRRFSSVLPQNWWRRFLSVWPQNRWLGCPNLGLKTDSYGLVIVASKSPRRFLGLGLKTMCASVCPLRHKTDGGMLARDTCRDLAACFEWKQVGLGFPSLALRLA